MTPGTTHHPSVSHRSLSSRSSIRGDTGRTLAAALAEPTWSSSTFDCSPGPEAGGRETRVEIQQEGVPGVEEEVDVTSGEFPDRDFDVVTGAFSYSGAAIARELERTGRRVRTLTGHPERARSDSGIEVRPLRFDDPTALTASLEGATTLYNTYWVRFPHGDEDYDRAVANSRTLFHAALRAGVERIVHVSI